MLAKVKSDGTMKVCYAQTTPDAYKDTKTGQWNGVFVDLTNELAAWMKVKVEPVEVTFATVILALNRGDCDLFGASLLYNAPRAMEIDYIIPFAAKGMNAVIAAGNPKHFSKPEDFNQDGRHPRRRRRQPRLRGRQAHVPEGQAAGAATRRPTSSCSIPCAAAMPTPPSPTGSPSAGG